MRHHPYNTYLKFGIPDGKIVNVVSFGCFCTTFGQILKEKNSPFHIGWEFTSD